MVLLLIHSLRAVSRYPPLRRGLTDIVKSNISSSNRRYSAQPLQDESDRPFSSSSTSTRRNHLQINDEPTIGRLVLVRHGQSEWNVTDPTRNLTARFTGWADIGLTQQGRDQAVAAGHAIQLAVTRGILPSKDSTNHPHVLLIPAIDVVFCSLLKRASDTMNIILEEIHLAEKIATPVPSHAVSSSADTTNEQRRSPRYQYPIPIIQSWRLNERHYGALVGLSKDGAERLYGRVRLTRWRDSWDIPPPPMPLEMVKKWGKENHCKPVTIVRVGDGGRTCIFDPAALGMQNDGKGAATGSGIRIEEHGGKRKRRRAAAALSTEEVSDQATTTATTTTTTTTTGGNSMNDGASFMPPSESLRDAYERFLPLWTQGIAKHIRAGRTVLVVAHANTIRSILVAIDSEAVTKDNAKKLKIPSALPLVYEFVDSSVASYVRVQESDGVYTSPRYVYNGMECSEIIPGNLRVLKPFESAATNFRLNGTWVETDETKSVSFCTDLGRAMGEQDIA